MAKIGWLDGLTILDFSSLLPSPFAAHLLAKFGAKVTPEAAVVGADAKLLYLGRISDLYADLGKRRTVPTEHDLRNALDAILSGKPVPHATGAAVGCLIPESK